MECPIHAKSKPKFTKAYSFGLVTGLFFYRHGPHNSSSNDQRAQRGNATRGAIHAVRLSSRTSIPSPSGTGSQGFATHLASGDLAMFYFRGLSLSPGKRRADVKPTRLLSERRIDQPVDYQEEGEVQGCDLNSQTNAQRLTAQHPQPGGHA
jgi:hypothetical protein